ncbi:MFS transporter [Allorhizocola rhizosphaerae]|uniref:MFS transporter n=1 Tax=Allorhizocola rhizosphaerae TaxID=1872709 RepID=UPI001FE5376D|nr:MFS transporter [Allorhizocola rhizosphaerae]
MSSHEPHGQHELTSQGAPPGLRRARAATSAIFLLFGAALGAWTARLPAIKQNLALSDGTLGLALLAFALGAIVGMQVAGRLVDRLGSARVMLPVAVAEGVGLVLPGFAPDLVALAVSLVLFGVVHGALNIAMNANAVEVQRAWGRPIITSFHAVYSIGGFIGAAAGGLFAAANLSARTTFVCIGAALLVISLVAGRWFLRTPPTLAESGESGRPTGVLLLGVLAFCCLVGEGAAADWSTVYLRDGLDSSPGFAAAAYAAFAIAMMAGRLVGDRLAARLGQIPLVRGSAALAALGLAAALIGGPPLVGVLGFGCLGAGLACIAPQVFAAAGERNPAHAGRAIARVAAVGYAGFLVGPVAIGAAAELVSLRWALLIPVVLTAFVAITAHALRPKTGAATA